MVVLAELVFIGHFYAWPRVIDQFNVDVARGLVFSPESTPRPLVWGFLCQGVRQGGEACRGEETDIATTAFAPGAAKYAGLQYRDGSDAVGAGGRGRETSRSGRFVGRNGRVRSIPANILLENPD